MLVLSIGVVRVEVQLTQIHRQYVRSGGRDNSEGILLQWLKKCPHVSQILKDSVIARHILNIRPNAW